jgi:hypothetical protein
MITPLSAILPDIRASSQTSPRKQRQSLEARRRLIHVSAVYPGCSEDVCVPILERESGLKFNKDFFAGHSFNRLGVDTEEVLNAAGSHHKRDFFLGRLISETLTCTGKPWTSSATRCAARYRRRQALLAHQPCEAWSSDSKPVQSSVSARQWWT